MDNFHSVNIFRKSIVICIMLVLIDVVLYAQIDHKELYDNKQKQSVVINREKGKKYISTRRTSQNFSKQDPVNFSIAGIRLLSDSGSLLHDVEFVGSTLTKSETPLLTGTLIPVTGGYYAYRLLPHGEHFDKESPAHLKIAYERLSLPVGFSPQDIYTYYFDDTLQSWQKLRRLAIDTINNFIISETTHFTDFINAVVRTPEMPEVNAFVPTTIPDVEVPNALQRLTLIAEPQVNSYGSAELTYPIGIPDGRKGLQPDISLSYSSQNTNGIFGFGWSIPQSAITIDTRWGVPRYDAQYETEIYTLNGMQFVLKDGNPTLRQPYQSNTQIHRHNGNTSFIARDTKNCDKIIRYGNKPSNYWWEVIDRNGTISYYGKYANDNSVNSQCVLKDTKGNIGYWALAEVIDISGNYIRFEYAVSSNNEIYPKYIYYTGHKTPNGTIDLEPSYRIFFHYDDRSDILKDGRLGFVRQTDSLVCYIDITYLNNNTSDDSYCWYMNRRFLLTYNDSASVSMLSQIQDHINYFDVRWPLNGSCLLPSGYHDVLNGTTTFDYHTVSLNGIFSNGETVIPFPNSSYTPLNKSENSSWNVGGTATAGFGFSYWNSNLSAGGNYNFAMSKGQTTQMLMDINGDGLTDLVYIKNNHIYFRPQHLENNNAWFGNEINTGIPAQGLSNEQSKTNTWGLQAGAEGLGLNANISGGMSYTDTYTSSYFSDVNGDGLPDYIADGKVYFNNLNTSGKFISHSGELEVILDSTRCTNFYYDGEVEVIPDCIINDTIVSTYTFNTPDCSLGFIGTEPEYTERPYLDTWDCEDCREAIIEYLGGGLCPIDLHSAFTDLNLLMRRSRASSDTIAEATGDNRWDDLEAKVIHCLKYCGYELVCEECRDYYDWYLDNPDDINLKELYENCKLENGCRSLCSECYGHLADGNEDAYLACADTYCLNGVLQGMNNPCTDCHDICVDDISNCKTCIYQNPTCFVCDECQDICVNDPDNCNQCKIENNCLGGITTDCEDICLHGNNTNDPYQCADCLINMGAYCEECQNVCLENPENCFNCVNRHCRYSESEAYINGCWANAWYSYHLWENNIRNRYPNVIIVRNGNQYYAHQIDTICPERTDPEIEAVRVWVAPKNGTITLQSLLRLVQDTSATRQQARQVDGVRCLIQHNKNVTVNSATHTLQAQASNIIDAFDIGADDYQLKSNTYSNISVKQGDVFFFHLRSVRTHNFDNVIWNQIFTYENDSSYSSLDDFICTADEVFQTDNNGTIVLNTDISCVTGSSAILRVFVNNQQIDSIPINSNSTHSRKEFSYYNGQLVSLELFSTDNLGKFEIKPRITFTPAQIDPTNFVYDQWLTPKVLFSREVVLDSVYYNLFGTLYRGWGQFAYNNLNALDNIPINTLNNSAIEYARTAPTDSATFCQSITFTEADTLQLMQEGGIEAAFEERNLYNPLDNLWIQMLPDISQYRWEAYGRVARSGRGLLSNTRDTKTLPYTIDNGNNIDDDEYVEFDSDVPVLSSNQRVMAVRKKSRTKQWNVNAGVGVLGNGIGHTYSESDYSVQTDFMDMNGDGYPDVVRSSTIQYTMPWGGLGGNISVKNFDAYSNHSVSNGNSISGNFAIPVKASANNIKDGKFLTHTNGSISGQQTVTNSEAAIAYIDINGDGLPDKLIRRNNIVLAFLNIGYGFASPDTIIDLSFIDNNTSVCVGGGAGASGDIGWGEIQEVTQNILGTESPTLASKYQVSLALGVDMNWSENKLVTRFIDMNGDGIPDVVRQTDNGFLVALMSAQGAEQQSIVNGRTIQRSKTFNWGINIGVTAGFPVWFLKICIGLNGSPKGQSTTQGTHDLIDMNGDGLPDLVWTDADGIHIRYNQLGKSRLLKSVTNPTGQKYEFEYRLSEPTCEQRGRQWLMSTMYNIDPHAHSVLGCDTMMRTFEYAIPHYDYAEKQFLGYGTTISNDINTDTLPHNKYRKTLRHYNNLDFIEHGKMTYEGVMDSNDNLFREYEIGTWYVDSTFTPTNNLCGDASIKVGSEVHYTRFYEGGSDRIVTAKQYKYDKYHNVIEYTNFGDSSLNNDELKALIVYDSTAVNTYNLISSPVRVTVYNNGTAVRETHADYQEGLLTELRQTDLLYSQTDTTNYYYDTFGLSDSIVLPTNHNGERAFTSIKYDTFSHTLPAMVTDQWGRTMHYTYDKFWKEPLSMIDPSGNSMLYSYDELGRLSTISLPGDTTRYSYYNPFNGITTYYTRRNTTVTYTYSPYSTLNEDDAYPYTQVQLHANNETIQKKVYYSHRGNLLYRQENGLNTADWRDKWVFSDITAIDCFGRTKTLYKNYEVETYNDITLDTDSLHVYFLLHNDILDRPTLVQWQNATQQNRLYSLGQDAYGVKRLKETVIDERGGTSQQFFAPQGWVTTSILPGNNTTSFVYDALGQLLSSTDPDGLSTIYHYNGHGQQIARQHPDAGTTHWQYDHAGNLIASATQRQINAGTQTNYEYDYNRLKAVHYPQHPQLDVTYEYDSVGRLAKREDLTGYETFKYDALGNISVSEKLLVVPSEDNAYHFKTQFKYDALGRIDNIIYPDSEKVIYNYYTGKLYSTYSRDDSPEDWGVLHYYISGIDYDANNNQKVFISGNGYTTEYGYDENRYWLTHIKTHNNSHLLQDINYLHDDIGNIISIEQEADSVRWLGGPYMLEYQYDSLSRLTKADMISDYWGEYSNYSMSYSPSGMVGIKSCPDMLWDYWFGYSANNLGNIKSHQVRSIYDMDNDETVFLHWDADGQLQNILRPCSGDVRHHWWNEDGQMTAFVDNERCGFYGYNGNGERAYKLTGHSLLEQYNAGDINFQLSFDDAVLYVNPYFIVTPKGYTQHYYNGNQHIATKIGKLSDLPRDIIDSSSFASERIANARSYMMTLLGTTEIQNVDTASIFVDIDGTALSELQWQCLDEDWTLSTQVQYTSNLLQPILTGDTAHLDNRVSGTYFYHPDHLGSATWITNSANGLPVQFIHYMPFGEMWYNQQASAYNERFKFTGKERDSESKYDYFGARYYASALPLWLSVDPLADKYPYISPYAYCGWNPIKYVDPNGKWLETAWDIANVAMDAVSLGSNIKDGNLGAAMIDGVGLVLDLGAAILPVVPGGAGTAIKAYREADKVVDATKVATTSGKNIATATKNTYRQALQKATGKIGKGYEAHHTLPQKYRERFEQLGINIDEPKNVVWRKTENHHAGNVEHGKAWDEFFEKNPQPTKEQVLQQRDIIEKQVWSNAPTGEIPTY